ncbi:MAG: flagellar biosynthesis protein FliQ [Gammaproteobacteria bacterium]
MSPESVLSIGQNAMQVTLMIIALLLLPALGVGLLVSVFQAATQINEQTLSFIPKLFVVFASLLFAGPWILETIIDFTRQLVQEIPMLIG